MLILVTVLTRVPERTVRHHTQPGGLRPHRASGHPVLRGVLARGRCSRMRLHCCPVPFSSMLEVRATGVRVEDSAQGHASSLKTRAGFKPSQSFFVVVLSSSIIRNCLVYPSGRTLRHQKGSLRTVVWASSGILAHGAPPNCQVLKTVL